MRGPGSWWEPAVERTERRDPDAIAAVEQGGKRLSGGLDAGLDGRVRLRFGRDVRRFPRIDQEDDGRGAFLAKLQRRQLAGPRPAIPVDSLEGIAATVLACRVELDAGSADVGGNSAVVRRRQSP